MAPAATTCGWTSVALFEHCGDPTAEFVEPLAVSVTLLRVGTCHPPLRPSRHPQIPIHIQNHIQTPLDFHENHPIDTVFHPDYDGLIPFSTHSKLWRPEASKDFFGGRRTPKIFIKTRVYVQFFMLIAMVKSDCPHIKKVTPLEQGLRHVLMIGGGVRHDSA